MAKKHLVKKYLQTNYIIYIAALIIFVVAVLLGAIRASKLTPDESAELSEITKCIFDGTYVSNYSHIIKQSVLDSAKTVALYAVLSFAVLPSLLSCGIVAISGFSIGFTSGVIISLYKMRGLLYILCTVAIRSVFAVPALVLLCGVCINYAIKRKNVKVNSLKFFALMFAAFAFFAVLNICNGFFSSFIIKGL